MRSPPKELKDNTLLKSLSTRHSKNYKQRKDFTTEVHRGNHRAHLPTAGRDYIRINIRLKRFYRKGRPPNETADLRLERIEKLWQDQTCHRHEIFIEQE